MSHESVLLHEAVEALNVDPKGTYIDGTFGRGGHSAEILKRLGENGRLIVFDKDPEAIKVAKAMQETDSRIQVEHASFAEMEQRLSAMSLGKGVSGVLLDLGLSSPQLDQSERGFSFMQSGPLDMRMNNQAGLSAKDWLETVEEAELARVIKQYGEERFSKRIARRIVEFRTENALTTTDELADIVSQAIPKWEKHKHPATRTFQAIRIFINRELDDLLDVLDQALSLLHSGGRLVVISFHSLEDRIVKQWMVRMEKGDEVPAYIPVEEHQLNKKLVRIGKPVKAGVAELERNIRARSAIMRIAEKR